MIQIQAVSWDEIDVQSVALHHALVGAIDTFLESVTAQALTAALSDITPEEQAFLDSLGDSTQAWETSLDIDVRPLLGEIANDAGVFVTAQIEENTGSDFPGIGSDFVRDRVDDSLSRMAGLHDRVLQLIAEQVIEGRDAGESLDQITARVVSVSDLSEGHAETVARTETAIINNASSIEAVRVSELTGYKIWLATEDNETRPTHTHADSQRVPLESLFRVGGSHLDFPGDPSGAPSETINCRCTQTYELDWAEDMSDGIVADATEMNFDRLGMIALVPSDADRLRLSALGGEPDEALHLTLHFLGDTSGWSDADVSSVMLFTQEVVASQTAIASTGFGVAAWAGNDDPCVVLQVRGEPLRDVKDAVDMAVGQSSWQRWAIQCPEQHYPWIPHVTLGYTDDTGFLVKALSVLGEITFDRVRISVGTITADFPLAPRGTSMQDADTPISAALEPSFSDGPPGSWEGILAIEGIETGDGRMFSPGAITWSETPLSLRWTPQDNGAHAGAVVVARIDEVYRSPENPSLIMGRGQFDISSESEYGKEAYRLVQGRFLRGISIDPDSIGNADVEMIWPTDVPEDEIVAPDLTIFHAGRIRAATLVSIPAFAEAEIVLTDGTMLPSQDAIIEEDADDDASENISDTDNVDADELIACACATLDAPPDEWFTPPDEMDGGLVVTASGRIYGYAATFDTCHVGYAGTCRTPPREDSHDYFMIGEVFTASGGSVTVGPIVLGTDHAALDPSLSSAAVMSHYADTGSVVADVRVGNDHRGIWVAGVLRPTVTADQVRALRASGRLSGDWRPIGGKLRLMALLAVNVPGFPIPRTRARSVAGRQMSLVAACVTPIEVGSGMRDAREALALRIGRDRRSRAHELKSRMV